MNRWIVDFSFSFLCPAHTVLISPKIAANQCLMCQLLDAYSRHIMMFRLIISKLFFSFIDFIFSCLSLQPERRCFALLDLGAAATQTTPVGTSNLLTFFLICREMLSLFLWTQSGLACELHVCCKIKFCGSYLILILWAAGCRKKYPDLEEESNSTKVTIVLDLALEKKARQFEVATNFGKTVHGCCCGSNCNCNPCNG